MKINIEKLAEKDRFNLLEGRGGVIKLGLGEAFATYITLIQYKVNKYLSLHDLTRVASNYAHGWGVRENNQIDFYKGRGYEVQVHSVSRKDPPSARMEVKANKEEILREVLRHMVDDYKFGMEEDFIEFDQN